MNPKKNSVLIVDDEELNRAILSGMLGSRYHILEADVYKRQSIE